VPGFCENNFLKEYIFCETANCIKLEDVPDNWNNIAPLPEQNTSVSVTTDKDKNLKKYSISFPSLSLLLLIAGFIANYNLNKKAMPLASQPASEIPPEKIKRMNNNKITEAAAAPDIKVTDKKQLLNNADDSVKQERLNRKNITRLSKKRKDRYNISIRVSDNIESEKILPTDEPGKTEKLLPKKISDERVIIQIHNVSEYAVNHFLLHQSILSAQLSGKKDNVNAEKKVSVNKKEKIKNQQGIYPGFMFGPSLNQIKTQGLRKSGYDFGGDSGISNY